MKYPICDKLLNLKNENRIPFHMPGHKRKHMIPFEDVALMDITEITDYDNLHHPEGMISDSMKQLKQIYHTKKSWYLVNGSTVGILSAISSVCAPGDKILIARNCHKAVYNAIRLLHLIPIYIYPSYSVKYDMLQGIMEPECGKIEKILHQNPEIRAVMITSPTYEGVVSDICAIKKITGRYNIPLIVDEAHGAHFVFHDYFPASATECGADIVIQSTHKTLPSFTQTALLHLCSDMVEEERIEEMLSIYETSSPSYLLMASAEYGVLYTQNHPDKVQSYVDNLCDFRRKCAKLQNISLLEPDQVKGADYDRGKLVFLVKDTCIDGKGLFDVMLQKYHIEFEMETACYCIAMTSVNDTIEDFHALEHAVFEIDQEITDRIYQDDKIMHRKYEDDKIMHTESKNNRIISGANTDAEYDLFAVKAESCQSVWRAISADKETIDFSESSGRISADYIYLYPPGIPVLVPGEKIPKEIVENMKYYLYNGYNVPALSDGNIRVLKEK